MKSTKKHNKLSALEIKTLTTPGRYNDGDGLYLHVRKSKLRDRAEAPTLYRSWVFRYRDRTTGKHRDKGLGPLRDVSLKDARESARKNRSALREGVDPIDFDNQKRIEESLERARRVTFGDCAKQYIETHLVRWRNAKHIYQWKRTLEVYCEVLTPLPVSEIDTGLVLRCLEPIWVSKTETATRVRQRMEAVLDWAKAHEYRTGENPARWRGHLDKLLAEPGPLKNVKHLSALDYSKIGEFMSRLREVNSLAAYAIELQILTATRPGETVGAQWSEFDLAAKVWTVPATRMKAQKEHEIPLSPQAMVLLNRIPKESKYVFPGRGRGGHITTQAARILLKRLQPGVTSHGFRSTFRIWAADKTNFQREVIEHALAHQLKDKVEAAYQRKTQFPKRAKLMTAWAGFCDIKAPTAASVIPFQGRNATRRRNE
jgi:integrase